MTLAAVLDRTTAPLDAARRRLFSLVLSRPLLAGVVARRERRLGVLLVAHTLVASAAALVLPMLLFVLGPVLTGVAHVAADVRYLVLRRQLPAAWRHTVWAGCLVLLGLRVLEEAHAVPFDLTRIEFALVAVWVAVGLIVGARQAQRPARAAWGLALVALLAVAAWRHPVTARLMFLHAHNLVAVALWATLFRSRLRVMAAPLAVLAACLLFFVSGLPFSFVMRSAQLTFAGLHLWTATDWVAPGLRADHALGLLLAFVLLQSVHYLMWLVVVPQEDVSAQGTPTFRMSARALVVDFGGVGLVVVGLAALVVLGGALGDVLRTQRLYLSLAMFHGYLELALAAYFWSRRGAAPAARVSA